MRSDNDSQQKFRQVIFFFFFLRSSSVVTDGSFPMSQRSFPPSFWNSSYQPSVSSMLGSALPAPHTELPFPGDPYSSVSLHSHLHQSNPDAWHASHHHHHHHHHPYSLGGAVGTQSSVYPRPGVHEMYGTAFDPRYGSLLVPSVRPHHRLTSGSSVPGPSASPCDLGGKGESGAGSAWSGAFTGAGAEIGLNVDTGIVRILHRGSDRRVVFSTLVWDSGSSPGSQLWEQKVEPSGPAAFYQFSHQFTLRAQKVANVGSSKDNFR